MALGKLNPTTNKYEYIHSNSAKTFPDNYLEVENAEPGKYLLYAKYLWHNEAENEATVSAYSPAATLIKEHKDLTSSDFLSQIFYSHAAKNSKKKVLNSSPQEWICSDMLLNNGGFGYLVVHLDPESKNKLGVELDEGYAFCYLASIYKRRSVLKGKTGAEERSIMKLLQESRMSSSLSCQSQLSQHLLPSRPQKLANSSDIIS